MAKRKRGVVEMSLFIDILKDHAESMTQEIKLQNANRRLAQGHAEMKEALDAIQKTITTSSRSRIDILNICLGLARKASK